MKKIHDYLHNFRQYLDYTIEMMNFHLLFSNELTNYTNFNSDIKEKMNILARFKNNIDCITPFKMSVTKVTEIGNIMYSFYQLYDNPEYHDAMLYSFGFNGYINNILGIKEHIDSGKMNATIYSLPKEKKSNKGKPIFKNMYYAKFINDEKMVKNDLYFKDN